MLFKKYMVNNMKKFFSFLLKSWNHWKLSSRLFFIFSIIFCATLLLTKLNIQSVFIAILWFFSFSGIIFIMTSKSFLTGFIINSLLLILLPFILINSHMIFLDKSSTITTLFITIVFFFISIIDFIIMAYHIPYLSNRNILLIKLYKNINPQKAHLYSTFFRIIILLIQYLIMLVSVLCTFAILYVYLGNITNEGIQTKNRMIQNWDALYFSAATFFTIGYGDISPHTYSSITKNIIMIQAIISHLITTILWPIVIIFASKPFNKNNK